MLFQVCYNIENNDTKNREIKSLIKAMNSFKINEGLIITENYNSTEVIENKKNSIHTVMEMASTKLNVLYIELSFY